MSVTGPVPNSTCARTERGRFKIRSAGFPAIVEVMQFNMLAELSKQAMQAYDIGQQFLAQDEEDGSDDLDVDAGLGVAWDWKKDKTAADRAAEQASDARQEPELASAISQHWQCVPSRQAMPGMCADRRRYTTQFDLCAAFLYASSHPNEPFNVCLLPRECRVSVGRDYVTQDRSTSLEPAWSK